MITNETIIELCEAVLVTWKRFSYDRDVDVVHTCLFCGNDSLESFDDIIHESQCTYLKVNSILEELKETIEPVTFSDLVKKSSVCEFPVKFKVYGDKEDYRYGIANIYPSDSNLGNVVRHRTVYAPVTKKGVLTQIVFNEDQIEEMYLVKQNRIKIVENDSLCIGCQTAISK